MHDTLQISTKFSSGNTGSITGLASPYGGDPDNHGDVVAPGAFAASLRGADTIPMLWQHDHSQVIGHWHTFTETPAGLMVKGQLNLDTPEGRNAFAHLKAGDIKGMSIGYMVSPTGQKRLPGGVRMLTEVTLKEISIVTVPAADRAGVTEVKSFESRSELKAALRDIGLSKAAAELVVKGGWAALSKESPDITELKSAALAIQHAAKWKV
ncbi:HK97 family phage prohead protease [Loktanella sp. R86503]|uniref:HK97 family phage prohead protease n=1 Tax=Loktanella sp. R86503 TaxID=3093847 RepID=UPI0036D9AC85